MNSVQFAWFKMYVYKTRTTPNTHNSFIIIKFQTTVYYFAFDSARNILGQ
jgi:hypothetical protein